MSRIMFCSSELQIVQFTYMPMEMADLSYIIRSSVRVRLFVHQ